MKVKKYIFLLIITLFTNSCTREYKLTETNSSIVVQSNLKDVFLGTPSIVKYNDLYYISHDYYGGEANMTLSSIYKSKDLKVWEKITNISGMYWGSLFVYNNRLYIIGTSKEYGDIVIGSSIDGKNWDIKSLILGEYHTSSLPFYIKNGFFYKEFEYVIDRNERHMWGNFVLKINMKNLEVDMSNIYYHKYKQQWIEGNIVLDKNNKINIFLRKNCNDNTIGVKMNYDIENNVVSNANFITLPGSGSKFYIKYDYKSQYYILISNPNSDCGGNRNILSLYISKDLKTWKYIIDLENNEDTIHYGYQYPSFIIDKQKLIIVIRSAISQKNFHDANQIRLKVIDNFRALFTKGRM